MQCVVAEVVGDKSILRAKVVTAYHRTNTGKHKKVKKPYGFMAQIPLYRTGKVK